MGLRSVSEHVRPLTRCQFLSGFDVFGNVKLFDFGLAKELVLSERDAEGMYLLTAETGSPR